MNSTNFIDKITDRIFGIFYPVSRFEKKLLRCQSYREGTVRRWSEQTGLKRSTTYKILENLEIFDARRIKDLIRHAVQSNADIFQANGCYITSFGRAGKSGHMVYYEFFHSNCGSGKDIEIWEVSKLPEESRIIFVDDLIGTGRQSLDYIEQRLSPMLSPSHKPCLFSICGTTNGMARVREGSTFDVLCAMELKDEKYNYYHSDNTIFSSDEKENLRVLSNKLGQNPYDLGLLVAFFYSTPNNTMAFIWKDGFSFQRKNELADSWFALLPRRY